MVMKKMRVLFLCQSIDLSDPVVGDTYDRALAFSRSNKIAHLDILTIKGRILQQPEKGQAISLHREKLSRLQVLFSFYKNLWHLFKQEKYHVVYIYMTPTLAPLFLPLRFFYSFKVATWFAHTIFRPLTKFSLQWASDYWFSVDVGQSQLAHPHKYLVGQGVNLNQFRFDCRAEKKWDLMTVGRITPQKKIEKILEAISIYKREFHSDLSFAIVGDAYVESDRNYIKFLESKIVELNLSRHVKFLGMVRREEMAMQLQSAKLFVFPVPGGIGKAAIEALACGVPILINYLPSKEFLGEYLSSWMISGDSGELMAIKMAKLFNASASEKEELFETMKKFAESNLSLDSLFEKISSHLYEELMST